MRLNVAPQTGQQFADFLAVPGTDDMLEKFHVRTDRFQTFQGMGIEQYFREQVVREAKVQYEAN